MSKFTFLFICYVLIGLYFFIRLIMSFIKKDDNYKRYGKFLGIYIAFTLLINIIGLKNIVGNLAFAWGYLSQSIINSIDTLFK